MNELQLEIFQLIKEIKLWQLELKMLKRGQPRKVQLAIQEAIEPLAETVIILEALRDQCN